MTSNIILLCFSNSKYEVLSSFLTKICRYPHRVAFPTPSASRGTSKPYYRSVSFPSASSRPYQSASFEGRAPFYPNDNNLASPSSAYHNKVNYKIGVISLVLMACHIGMLILF